MLSLGIIIAFIVGIAHCWKGELRPHRLRKRFDSRKLRYLNQAFEGDNNESRVTSDGGTARRSVSHQFSRSSLTTQYGYAEDNEEDLTYINSNFSLGVRDEDGGLVMRPVGPVISRLVHGGPDGGEASDDSGPSRDSSGNSPTATGASPDQSRGSEKRILDETSGEYLWPAPPPPPPPPPLLKYLVKTNPHIPVTEL